MKTSAQPAEDRAEGRVEDQVGHLLRRPVASGTAAPVAVRESGERVERIKVKGVRRATAAAVEEGVVTPSTPMIIPPTLPRSDTSFRDSHPHGTLHLTFAGALAQSSNMGMILAGEKMSAKTLDDYYRRFGLGSPSGTGFPGETAGILTPVDEMNGTQRYTVMFGQGLSVTAVQAAGVFQTIANDGVRVPPRILKATIAPDGTRTDGPSRLVDWILAAAGFAISAMTPPWMRHRVRSSVPPPQSKTRTDRPSNWAIWRW